MNNFLLDSYFFFTLHTNIFLVLVTLISLFVGSFLNVVIYRLPRMMEQSWSEECRLFLGLTPEPEKEHYSLSYPFSHCPQCKKTIRPWHNIPLISYFWLRGKCAYCHAHISIRYPIVEFLTVALSFYIAWQWGFSLQTLFGLIFTWIIIALTFIDIDRQLLPDSLTLLLLWVGLIASIFNVFCTSTAAILGATIGYLVFAIIQTVFGFLTGKTGIGQGDYKFLAALGAFLGAQYLPIIILFSAVIGLISALTHMVFKRQFESVPLPYGPYLAIAGWISLLWGKAILNILFLH